MWKFKASKSILISNREFKQNLVRRDKGHCILKKRTIQQEYITILNIYAPNIGGLKFIKQTLLGIKEEISPDPIIWGDLNIPLSSTNRTSR
jgi:hypothetical protein